MSDLSVVVATRDRPQLLEGCLASLSAQTDPDFEVVVVDDGSACDLAPVIGGAGASDLSLTWVRQEPAGLSVARNAGARAARGAVLAYLDDDAVACETWAGEVKRAFDQTGCAALAGRIELAFEAPPPRWLRGGLRAFLAELDLGPAARPLRRGETPFGANCAVRREVLEAVGGFSSNLGRTGQSLRSNEEVAFFRAVARRGELLMYEPGALVHHRVPPERMTRRYMVRRAFAQGQSDAALDPIVSVGREVLAAARTPAVFLKGLAHDQSTVSAQAWLGYCRGRWAARRSLLGA